MTEFKGTKGKWKVFTNAHKECNGDEWGWVGLDVFNSKSIKKCTIHWSGYEAKANALLISKAPEMLFELNETLKDLLVLQGNVLESAKIDKRWDGMCELIQIWIDRKKQLIKEATEF